MDDLIMRLNRMQHGDPRTPEIGKAAAARIQELEAENKKLKEALKPFGGEAKWWPKRWNDDCEVHIKAPDDTLREFHTAAFNLADLRRAAALGEKP